MLIRRILIYCLPLFVAGLLLGNTAYAVPAAPVIHTLTQPDGLTFKASQWGDEWSHGWETLEGYSIVFDQGLRSWTYAMHGADGSLISSLKIVGRDDPPGDISKYVRPIGQARRATSLKELSRELSTVGPQGVVPSKGTANIPVILINFNDTATTYTSGNFNTLLFGTGNYSMRDYYQEVSYGAFSVSPGPGGVAGWYNASNTHDYYGSDVIDEGVDAWPGDLVYEAVAAADAAGFNFSPYDQDGDCYVDVVAIVHQGSGQEASGVDTDIWSHRSNLKYGATHHGEYTTNDTCIANPSKKVKVNNYIIQPETLWGGQTTMGVFAHEYGHVLGLPDLYDTDKSSVGIGYWSLMASGNWNFVSVQGDRPAHPDAWCKYKLGWVTPIQVSGTLTNEPISQAAATADVYQLRSGSPSTWGEYFLVENRQKAGFDAGLPGAGLLIWHIDESKSTNTGECYPGGPSCASNHYHVALVQADNLWNLEKGNNKADTGDPYPGSTGNGSFTGISSPNSNQYDGHSSNVHIANISPSAPTMTATLSFLGPVVPTIVSTTPANEAKNVPIHTTINIQFSTSMATTGFFYFEVKDDDQNEIPGSIQWTTTLYSNDTMIFTPNETLRPATHYTVGVLVNSSTGAFLDGYGRVFEFYFITNHSSADATSPIAQGVYPHHGATGVSTTTKIFCKFSEAMDPASINSTNITLAGGDITSSDDYSVVYDFEDLGSGVTIEKISPFLAFSQYTATITTNVRDLRGNWLKEQYQWNFTTGAADTTPPTVTQTIPASGDTKVNTLPYIHVIFSEVMDISTLNAANITLSDNLGNPVAIYFLAVGDDFVSFAPVYGSWLQSGATYTVSIGTGVKDRAGYGLSTPYSWSFTTAGAGEDSDPFVAWGLNIDNHIGIRWSDNSTRLNLGFGASDDRTNPLTVTATTPSSSKTWKLNQSDSLYSYESIGNEGLSSGNHTLKYKIQDGASNQVTFERDIYVFDALPTLVSPTNGATGISTTPVLQWSYSGTLRPTYYVVAVFDGPDLNTARIVWLDFTVDQGSGTHSITIPADKQLAPTIKYYWKVIGLNAGGRGPGLGNGETWSVTRSFTTGGVPLPVPGFEWVMVRSDNRPEGMRWNLGARVLRLSPADIMELKVTGPGGFRYLFTEDDILQGEQNGLYFWRLVSQNLPNGSYTFAAKDVMGRTVTLNYSFSNAITPRVDSSTVVPTDSSYVNTTTPTLSWADVGSQYYYRIRIFDWNYREDAVYTSPYIQETQITVPSGYLLPNTPYRWRVEVYDASKNNRSVSNTLGFSTGSYPYTLNLNWGIVWSDNNYYSRSLKNLIANVIGPLPNEVTQINVAGPGGFSYDFQGSNIQHDLVSQGAIYVYSGGGFPTDGTYDFTVGDKYGASKSYSKDQTSTEIPIVDQSSLSPANNAYLSTLTPTFTWAEVEGSNRSYRLVIYDWKQSYIIYSSERSGNLYAPVPSGILHPNRSYKWRVEVFDDSDGLVADNRSSSGWNCFTVVEATTPPSTPTNVQASDGAYTDKVRVTWTASAGAASYTVYRATSSLGTKTDLGSTSGTSYDDTTAIPGTTYTYWVKASNSFGTSGFSASDTGFRAMGIPLPPTNVQASDGAYTDRVQVTWTASSGATSYEVWRHTVNDSGSAAQIASSVTGTSYGDTSAVVGTTYTYWVKASNSFGTSGFSASDTGYRKVIPPAAPTNVQASDGPYPDRVQVTWTASSGATLYTVYRATSSFGAKTELGSTSGTSYDDTTATPWTAYYYCVKASNPFGISKFSTSNKGSCIGIPPPPKNVKASDTYTDRIQVSWAASVGATSYEVWCHTVNDPELATRVGSSITGTSYGDKSAAAGTTYYYWVKASNSFGTSGFSASDTGYRKGVPPAAPTNVQASDGTDPDKVAVTWTASSGATSYTVYRATTAYGTKTALGETLGAAYDDTTGSLGTTYYYSVKASNAFGISRFSASDKGYRQ